MNQNQSQSPKAGWRIAVTLILLLACGVSVRVISLIQGPIEGPIAVRQLEDNAVDYSLGRAIAVANIPGWIEAATGGLVVAIWVTYVLQYSHYRRQRMEPDGATTPSS